MFVSLDEFFDKTDEVQNWLVYPFIPEDAFILVSGQMKRAMKTFFAYKMAWLVASGKTYGFMEPSRAAKVLIIQEESSGAENKVRLKAIAKGLGLTDAEQARARKNIAISFKNHVKLDDEVWRQKLQAQVKKHEPGLVILDVFSRLHSGDEVKTHDVERVIDTIHMLRYNKCSVMLLTHLKKSANDDPKMDLDDQVRGNTALPGAYDVHLGLRRYKMSEQAIQLHMRSRSGEPTQYSMSWAFEQITMMVDGKPRPHLDSATPTIYSKEEADVDALVEKHRESCVVGNIYSTSDLRKEWGESISTVKQVLAEMADIGLMSETNKKGQWIFTGAAN